VAFTPAVFSIVTVSTATDLGLLSISYIDDRKFPGSDGGPPPGPLGYSNHIYSTAISNAPRIMFFLNTCLTDGLTVIPCPTQPPRYLTQAIPQLYRFYRIFSSNLWVVAFPCLMYLASFGMYLGLPLADGDILGSCHRYSNGYNLYLPSLATGQVLRRFLSFVLLNFGFSQHPPQLHDRWKRRPTCQGHSKSQKRKIQRILQVYRHHAYRVLCPLHCYLSTIYQVVGRAECHSVYPIPNTLPDSGACCFYTLLARCNLWTSSSNQGDE
jgi:hypothetical protein